MRPFTFNPGPRLLAGPDQATALAEKLPPGPCLLVTDAELIRLGLTDAYREAICAEREVVVFDAVEADPSKETLLAAIEAGRQANVTSVVAVGGGSPMDVAKLASYLLGSGENLDEIWGVNIAQGRRLPLALVPTTAGTGSEATPISVITCEGGVKLAVNSPPLIADWAVLDATLTLGLPGHVTAATGIDAIVHAVEAYTSALIDWFPDKRTWTGQYLFASLLGSPYEKALLEYYGTGQLVPALAASAVLGVQLGSWGGMRFGRRASAMWLKLLMAVVLFVVSAVMFTRGIR